MVALSRRRALLAAPILAALIAAVPGAPDAPGAPPKARCAKAKPALGEWRSYGHDFANTRTQPRERKIGPEQAGQLGPAWTFSTVEAGGEGDITGTPVVAGGCLYVGTNEGWLFALNAQSGKVVWKRELRFGGGVNSSAAVVGRRVYFSVSRLQRSDACRKRRKRDACIGPYVVALSARTGRFAWQTRSLDRQPGSDSYGSPVVIGRTLMIGVSGGAAELGDEADRYAFQGSMVFLDTRRGRLLRKTWTIHPPNKPNDDFAGAGIWSTPAVDRAAKLAYAGTANPFRPQAEHPRSNAVVKFDVDRRSRRFGKIIGAYKGNVDEYFPGLSELPCYDIPGNPPPYYPQGIGACGDIDLDFGASANLFRVGGRKVVGAGQKSGVYHVFDARTMKPVWTEIVGPPSAVGGIVGSTGFDGQSVYGPVTVPSHLWSLSKPDGELEWATPVGDGVHWGNPVAVANGVVYTTTFHGFLNAYDAASGALLASKPLPAPSWAGVSIARNTVYAAVGIRGQSEGFVVAFRRGASGGGGGGGGGDGGGGGGGGGASSNPPIVAMPGAASSGYATPVASVEAGGEISFHNLDVSLHDVTAEENGPDGKPLFSTPLIGVGETAPLEGLDRVTSGRSYAFFCTLHPGMRGQLAVR